ncbi:hypothetical protein ACFWWM_25175 [Streptomyces sp. NPDC058682]|uniref:hypothetical protein n=1 Tax=unclassified Streptomyces TaxID=2593676 RepID=UPI002256A8EE|nr:hypothetical protein [Streptomyces sp. NBC_01214]MCX4804279.1 hypothetical protein [Streptomyces sp. NBC_01214]
MTAPTAQARTSESAASCFDPSTSYSKPAGDVDLPAGRLFSTSNACTDIHIRPHTNRYINVCFETQGRLECQANYALARGGQWNTIATNVRHGALFAFSFRSDAAFTGRWAARPGGLAPDEAGAA